MPTEFTYTVDPETFHVRIYQADQELPIVFQPDYPDATPWENKEAAIAWAEQCVAGLEAAHDQMLAEDNAAPEQTALDHTNDNTE